MSLLTDVRFSLKKYIQNDVACNVIAYETYKKCCKVTNDKPSSERFEEVVCNDYSTLIYDTKTKKGYLRLENKFYSSKTFQD